MVWRTVHPWPVRLFHWVNAGAFLVMLLSGWRIYNAAPVFGGWRFPNSMTLGGWLAGALQWHFAAMWVLGVNGALYLLYGAVTGRFAARFWPLDVRGALRDIGLALRGRLSHADLWRYNAVQRCLYAGVIGLLILQVVSGLVMWKPVQFPLLRTLLGDYDHARQVHFVASSLIVLFLAVHVGMALRFPRALLGMLGWHFNRKGGTDGV